MTHAELQAAKLARGLEVVTDLGADVPNDVWEAIDVLKEYLRTTYRTDEPCSPEEVRSIEEAWGEVIDDEFGDE